MGRLVCRECGMIGIFAYRQGMVPALVRSRLIEENRLKKKGDM